MTNVRTTIALTLAGLAVMLLIAPTMADAHTTYEYPEDDPEYFITIGQDGEPVYTFQRTNIDLIIREYDDGERGDEVPGLEDTLDAEWISPSGEVLDGELTRQHGEEGRYDFDDGYVLTEPGFYTLRLTGTIGDVQLDGAEFLNDHNIRPLSDVYFPATDILLPDDLTERIHDLEQENEELENRIAQLENQIENLETGNPDGDVNEASAPGLIAIAIAGLIGAGVLARNR